MVVIPGLLSKIRIVNPGIYFRKFGLPGVFQAFMKVISHQL